MPWSPSGWLARFTTICAAGPGGGRWVALAWAAGVIAMSVVWRPLWQPIVAVLGAESLFLAWWLRLKPSNDRDWDPSAALLPRAVLAGDAVTIENVRNLEYRSVDDFTPNWGKAYISSLEYQGSGCHFLRLGRRVEGPPCPGLRPRTRWPHLHVPSRRGSRRGSNTRSFAVLYRQQELIFVAADERDIILRRTKYSERQWGYLYHLNSSPEELRVIFLDYVNMINQLHKDPRWYHVLFTNCTTSFYKLPSTHGSAGIGASLPTPVWIGSSIGTVDWIELFPSRNSADSPTSTTLRTRPHRRDLGIISAANSKGAAMNDEGHCAPEGARILPGSVG